MPTLRKLTINEVRALETKPLGERAQVAAEYDTYLQEFAVDDYGEVQLDEADNRLTVRNRLQAAAGRRGFALAFRRTSGPLLRFRVEAATDTQSQAEPVPPAAVVETPQPEPVAAVSQEAPAADTPKRRGRPPRTEKVPAAAEVPAAQRRGQQPQGDPVAVVVEPKRRRRKPRSQI